MVPGISFLSRGRGYTKVHSTGAQMLAHMWRPEGDIKRLLPLPLTLFTEARAYLWESGQPACSRSPVCTSEVLTGTTDKPPSPPTMYAGSRDRILVLSSTARTSTFKPLRQQHIFLFSLQLYKQEGKKPFSRVKKLSVKGFPSGLVVQLARRNY